LERHLGPLNESLSVSEKTLAEAATPFAVLCFASTAEMSWATFGISRHALASPDGASTCQELLLLTAERNYAIDVLRTLGSHVLSDHSALQPGERHELPGWRDDSPIQGVIALPNAISAFAEPPNRVEFMRLIPISASEAKFAREAGWQALKSRLIAAEVDLADLYRSPTV
jgi:hypothetical protein